jgi:DNA-binding winged helix-turn-helix (wHTH) protein
MQGCGKIVSQEDPCLSSAGRSERHVRQYRFGDYKLDLEGGFLRRGDEEVALRAKSFEVLTYLVERHGRLVTKTELIEGVWPDAAVTDNSLAQCLVEIRRALDDDAQELVRTVARRGYLFVAPVTAPPREFPRNSGEAAPILAPALSTRRNWRILGVAIVLSALAGAGVLFVWLSEAKTVAPRTPVRITWDGLAIEPTISRDGNLLAYASKAGGGKMHIWVRQTAGGQAAQVTRGGDDEAAPDFSPDGTQIVFRSERDGGGIYTASTLGGGEPQLLVKGGANPRFSPNGKDVLFFSDDLWAPKAYIVSRLGGPPRQVCPNWATDYGFWAPDGSAILFHGGRKGYMDDPIWMLASVAGGEPTKFHLPGDVPHVFAWRETRDGRQWVLFGSGAGDTYNLFRIAVGHGRLAANPEQLTAGAGVSPDFSQRRPWLSGAPVHVKFSAAGPKKDVHFCNVYYAEGRTGRPRADQRTANTMSALR